MTASDRRWVLRAPIAGMPNPMVTPLISRVDAAIGDAIEAAVQTRHRRRLRRLGWERALDPPDDSPWAAGDPPPRDGSVRCVGKVRRCFS